MQCERAVAAFLLNRLLLNCSLQQTDLMLCSMECCYPIELLTAHSWRSEQANPKFLVRYERRRVRPSSDADRG